MSTRHAWTGTWNAQRVLADPQRPAMRCSSRAQFFDIAAQTPLGDDASFSDAPSPPRAGADLREQPLG